MSKVRDLKDRLSVKAIRTNEIYTLIMDFYKRELTKEEEMKLLRTKEEELGNNTEFCILLWLAKECIVKGQVTKKEIIERCKAEAKKDRTKRISLNEIPEEYQKDPTIKEKNIGEEEAGER